MGTRGDHKVPTSCRTYSSTLDYIHILHPPPSSFICCFDDYFYHYNDYNCDDIHCHHLHTWCLVFIPAGGTNQYKMTGSMSMPSSLGQVDRDTDFGQLQQQVMVRPASRGSGSIGISPSYSVNQPLQQQPQMLPRGYSAAEEVAFQQTVYRDGGVPIQVGFSKTICK